jgi:hypothetical protein
MKTIRELICDLQTINNQDQPYIGFIRIAEDYEFYDENGVDEMISPSIEVFSKVSQWRSIDKAIDYALSEISDLIYDGILEQKMNEKENN